MDFMYDITLPFISKLQTSMPHIGEQMEFVSVTFDPKYAFLVYAPIVFILNRSVGKKLILAVVLAEWLNQLLKWASFGERPYWYVHSSNKFESQQTPIRQFDVTCETGPGAPSGHSQLTAALWLVIIESINAMVSKFDTFADFVSELANKATSSSSLSSSSSSLLDSTTTLSSKQKNSTADDFQSNTTMSTPTTLAVTDAKHHRTRIVTYALRVFYVLLVALVAFSRIYLACHFPQQCFAGALLGFFIAKYALNTNPSPKYFIGLTFAMLTSVFGVYASMLALGFDPSWTFNLAIKYCKKPENIHIDTTPFFSVMRYCGFALGSGLGLLLDTSSSSLTAVASKHIVGHQVEVDSENNEHSALNCNKCATLTQYDDGVKKNAPSELNYLTSITTKIFLALVSARLVDNLAVYVSPTAVNVFYMAAFASYTAFSFMIVSL